LIKRANPRKQGREFGIVMAIFFGLVAAFRYRGGHGISLPLLVIASIFFILGVVAPKLLVPLFGAWTKFGKALGYVNSRVLLFLFYYLLVTPIALIRRAFNPDPLNQRLVPAAESYWDDCEPETQESLERQY
jgi:hypothetical protein